jgi:hypothetical protein
MIDGRKERKKERRAEWKRKVRRIGNKIINNNNEMIQKCSETMKEWMDWWMSR